MKKIITLSIFIFSLYGLNAQSWSVENISNARQLGVKKIVPEKFILAKINDQEVKEVLWKAPMESTDSRNSSRIIIMLSDGSVDEFEIVEYSMMESDLARKFPDFKTFYGKSTNNKFRSIRLDYTLNGIRAVISDESGNTYIDPYQTNDNELRIIYRKEDITRKSDWDCLTESSEIKNINPSEVRFAGDCMLREYRLAVAATGEYTAFHGGTVPSGQAAIVTAMNRVNQVFEQDIACRMILVGNNDLLVYTNSGTDPYTNSNGSTMLGQNQTNVDNIIGKPNYDIGHVFSTGGGGVAYLRSLCNEDLKAGGVTGQPNPTNDPFWIDYVAHEMGHQYGGNHTQNNSCQRNTDTAVEPGSASTIMGYAGICTPNVQSNSDPYFHAISIAEMTSHITSTSCAVVSGFGNSAPVVSAISNYIVPKSTFLVLDVNATDANSGDNLTYCWEQMDNQVATMPPVSTNTGGPAFRSINPSSDSKRYLPSLSAIISNTTPTWEVLPSVTRDMNWRVTVRDHSFTTGCTDEKNMIISVDGGSGPFIVNNGSIPSIVSEGQNVPLTWNVAGTDLAPVNCANVDIFMSIDGGLTYPIILLSNVTNDGVESFVVPAGLTTTARIMVKCSDNIFFDINDADIEVEVGGDGFTMALDPTSGNVCNTGTIEFDINTVEIGSYNTPITMNITGIPPSANVSYSVNPVIPGNSTTVTLSNFGSNMGNFTLVVTGSSGGNERTKNYALGLFAPTVAPTLVSPVNNALDVSLVPTLSWNSSVNAASYEYQVSTVPNGGNVISTGVITTTTVNVIGLTAGITYYWRVRAINGCGTSSWSSEQNFTTELCAVFMATDLPLATIHNGQVDSYIEITNLSGTIADVDVINVAGSHNRVSDVQISMFSPNDPNSTQVDLFFNICGNNDDFDLNFDDQGGSATINCPPNTGQTVQAFTPLSTWNGQDPNGLWQLSIIDGGNRTLGTLESWGLKFCLESEVCDLTVTSTNSTGAGSLLSAISCATSGDEIILNTGSNSIIDLASAAIMISKNLTISANPADNIIIKYSGSGSALEVMNGFNLTLEDIIIEQGAQPKGKNTKVLKLKRNLKN